MPKIIDQAKQRILDTSTDILVRDGYNGLSIRKVASRCSIAIGTIYNYFPNKNSLINEVLRKEWTKTLSDTKNTLQTSEKLQDGIILIADNIESFLEDYHITVREFSKNVKHEKEMLLTRKYMEKDVSELLTDYFKMLDKNESEAFISVLSSLILNSFSSREKRRENLIILLDRIYPRNLS